MMEQPIPLSEGDAASLPDTGADARPKMYEPPPVRLVTVDDAHLPAAAGRERELEGFYRDLLEFEREEGSDFPIFRAANFRILFDILEPPIEREDFRALGIEVASLGVAESRLTAMEIPYELQRSVMPGNRQLLLRDPAGNWIVLSESRAIR